MPILIGDHHYSDQPPLAPLGINWRNPITRGLISSFVPVSRADQVQRGAILDTSTAGAIIGRKLVVSTSAATTVTYGDLTQYAGARQFTSLSVVTPRSLTTRGSLFATPDVSVSMGYTDSSKIFAYSYRTAGHYFAEAVAGFFVAGERVTVAWRFDRDSSAYHSFFKNGVLATSGNGVSATTLQLGALNLGGPAGGSDIKQADIDIEVNLLWLRALSDAEIRSISINPWQVFEPAPIGVYWSTASGTSLTPSSGRITYTGKTPSVNLPVSLTPSSGHVTYTGKTPSVTQSNSLTPTTGHITLTGRVPSVDQDITLTPSSGRITYTGKTPTVDQTSATSLTPTSGHITFTGYAPSVDQDISLTPSLGHITYTGKTPSVTQSAGLSGRAKYWNGSAWESITFV